MSALPHRDGSGDSASAKARSRQRGRSGGLRLRVLCGVALLACGGLLMLAALPGEALASTNWATGVEASLPANASMSSGDGGGLGSVSCASAGNCTAVGNYFYSAGHYTGQMLTETSGTWAAGIEASLPANAGTNSNGGFGSVSCASAGNCTAVGGYTDGSGHGQGLLLTETSGIWAAGVEASLPANAATNSDVGLDSLSCGSAGNCTAVGDYESTTSGYSHGLLLTETSGTWTTGVEAPLPANAGSIPDTRLDSVSCASAGNCTAVGNYEDSSGHLQGLLLTETSGTWAAGVEASLPANAGTTAFPQLGSVSCASAGNCSVVGTYDDSSGNGQGLLLTETSGAWAAGVEASLPANAGTGGTGVNKLIPQVGAVSCASVGNCTAVGSYPDGSGHLQGLLLTEMSGTWAPGVEASLPANNTRSSDSYFGVSSVSCASARNCTAVGRYKDSSGQVQGLLLTQTSGTWAPGVEASLPANATTNPYVALDSVSCASAGNCTAVGDYVDRSDNNEGLLLTETPGSALALIGRPASNGAGVTDKLICAPSAFLPCRATETLTTTETTKGGRPVALSASRRKSRKVKVATKTVTIHTGKAVTVTVKLNDTGRKLLARFGKLPVTLTITLLQNERHVAVANTKLTVKPKKK